MSDILQIASIGLLQGRERLEAISANAASATLPGYRRHVVTGRAFDAALTAPDASAVVAATSAEVARRVSQVDLQSGAMIETGRALDLAIESDELFFALTDGTQTWLTRAGSFHIDEGGVLLGERELRVVGAQGEVRLPGSEVEVGADGRITHQGAIVATLQLFQPNDRGSLLAAQGSLLEAPAGMHPAEPGIGRVRSGMLEASNTDAAREMLSLMALSRQFETLSQIVQSYDELLGRAIQKFGEV
jgi:flagellar basal body rod protein FlgG